MHADGNMGRAKFTCRVHPVGTAWEWGGDSLRMGWGQPGNEVGTAWEWGGDSLGQAWWKPS